MEVEKISLEQLRQMGVEGERRVLLSQYMEEKRNEIPAEAELVPVELLLLQLGDLYEEYLSLLHEKNRLASFVCASGNLDSYVAYSQDTEGTTLSEYAKVVEETIEKNARAEAEELRSTLSPNGGKILS